MKFELINTIKFKYYLFLQKKDFKYIKTKVAEIFLTLIINKAVIHE